MSAFVEMEIVLPAPQWALLQAACRASGTFERGGRSYEVILQKTGPWADDHGPSLVAVESVAMMASAEPADPAEPADQVQRVLFRQGLPLERLSVDEAVALDRKLQRHSGWRRRLQEQSGLSGPATWASYGGHPVAVYRDDAGRRWASLPFRLGAGADEILLDRSVVLDGDEALVGVVAEPAQDAVDAPIHQGHQGGAQMCFAFED